MLKKDPRYSSSKPTVEDQEKAALAEKADKLEKSLPPKGRGPITQPGPMPRPTIPRDIGLGNGPRGLPPKGKAPSTNELMEIFGGQKTSGTMPKMSGPLASGGTGVQQPGLLNTTYKPPMGTADDFIPRTPRTPLGPGGISGALKNLASQAGTGMKKGGKVKSTSSYKSGGSVSSASKRGDGCAQRGKTKGRMV